MENQLLNEYSKYINVPEGSADIYYTITGTAKDGTKKSTRVFCNVYMLKEHVPIGKVFAQYFKDKFPTFAYDFVNISHRYVNKCGV